MNATTVAVDWAKSVFQLAVADASWRVIETHRLTRTQFERWFANRDVALVIKGSRGSAHHWARRLNGLGIEVRLLHLFRKSLILRSRISLRTNLQSSRHSGGTRS